MRPIKSVVSALAGATLLAIGTVASFADSHDEITVAYLTEWPLPFQFAKVNGIYEQTLGIKVNWLAVDTGIAMSEAMAEGDVQISIGQGVPPFVVATSAGQNLQVADVAVSYSESDNCVVKTALEINKNNAKELEGKKVGVPIGTAAHYGFLKQMAYFGIDTSTMNIVDLSPPDGAVTFAGGGLDMVCGWGGHLRKMKEFGNVLLTGAEKEELGIHVFDVTSVSSEFASEHPELLAGFLKITADMNQKYLTATIEDPEEADEMIAVIAKDAGMDVDAAKATLAEFVFPTIEQQLSDKWLGGKSQVFLKEVADFLVITGSIPSALNNYTGVVNSKPLSSANQLP